MKVSPINESLSCKARLDKKTLRTLAKDFENTKVENQSLETLLKNFDNKGSKATRISIGDVIKTKASKYYRNITITNPLFGNAEYVMQTPQKTNEASLESVVKWMCETKTVEKMEGLLFGSFLETMKAKAPNTPAVEILRGLLPSFRVGGCSQNTIKEMINIATEADKKALLGQLEQVNSSVSKSSKMSPLTSQEPKKYVRNVRESIIQKYS